MLGICMEYAHDMLGICMNIPGICKESAWNTHEYLWNMLGMYRNMLGMRLEHAWNMHGIRTEYA